MKHVVFGCTLMLCGLIGAFGWLIASCTLAGDALWRTPWDVLFSGPEIFPVLAFGALSVLGAVFAWKGLFS